MIYGSGLRSAEPVHVVIQSSVAGFALWFFFFSALMSAREISADNRKYAGREGDDR